MSAENNAENGATAFVLIAHAGIEEIAPGSDESSPDDNPWGRGFDHGWNSCLRRVRDALKVGGHFGTEVYAEVAAERERAHVKHGRTSMESSPVRGYRRLAILVEEVGEVAKEFNEAEHRGGLDQLDLVLLRKELIQVAAMAAAWADRLGFELSSRPESPGST
jgi:NTP pyrophosphatase (non-canonical NTP hydrolase)